MRSNTSQYQPYPFLQKRPFSRGVIAFFSGTSVLLGLLACTAQEFADETPPAAGLAADAEAKAKDVETLCVSRRTTRILAVPAFEGGVPKTEAISGTSLQYVTNSSSPVLKTGDGSWFACENGIWFSAVQAGGPWEVAIAIPSSEIERIPADHPVAFVAAARLRGYDGTNVWFETAKEYYAPAKASLSDEPEPSTIAEPTVIEPVESAFSAPVVSSNVAASYATSSVAPSVTTTSVQYQWSYPSAYYSSSWYSSGWSSGWSWGVSVGVPLFWDSLWWPSYYRSYYYYPPHHVHRPPHHVHRPPPPHFHTHYSPRYWWYRPVVHAPVHRAPLRLPPPITAIRPAPFRPPMAYRPPVYRPPVVHRPVVVNRPVVVHRPAVIHPPVVSPAVVHRPPIVVGRPVPPPISPIRPVPPVGRVHIYRPPRPIAPSQRTGVIHYNGYVPPHRHLGTPPPIRPLPHSVAPNYRPAPLPNRNVQPPPNRVVRPNPPPPPPRNAVPPRNGLPPNARQLPPNNIVPPRNTAPVGPRREINRPANPVAPRHEPSRPVAPPPPRSLPPTPKRTEPSRDYDDRRSSHGNHRR